MRKRSQIRFCRLALICYSCNADAQASELGRTMARLYIKFETMAAICDATVPSTLAEVVRRSDRVDHAWRYGITNWSGRMQGQLCVP